MHTVLTTVVHAALPLVLATHHEYSELHKRHIFLNKQALNIKRVINNRGTQLVYVYTYKGKHFLHYIMIQARVERNPKII
jgi:hypothetical protein